MALSQKILNYLKNPLQQNFNTLALEVFTYQYTYCLPYQHYCQQLKRTPTEVSTWQQVPAVSTEAFREFDLCTQPSSEAGWVFYTSGTTEEKKGKHYYHDLSLYNAAIRASFLAALALEEKPKILFRILTPSFTEVPSCSLFYMF